MIKIYANFLGPHWDPNLIVLRPDEGMLAKRLSFYTFISICLKISAEMSLNLTAVNCLLTYGSKPQAVLSGNLSWPFLQVPVSVIEEISEPLVSPIRNSATPMTGLVTSSIGIGLSAVSIVAVWRKTFKEKNSFYAPMMIIAFLDFFVQRWERATACL